MTWDFIRLCLYIGSALVAAAMVGKLVGVKNRLALALGIMTIGWLINSVLLGLWLVLDVGRQVPPWVAITRGANAALQLACPLVVLITLDQGVRDQS